MPRFTVKDMLLATTLIAIGAGLLAILVRNGHAFGNGGIGTLAIALFLWYGSGACIGAGMLTLVWLFQFVVNAKEK